MLVSSVVLVALGAISVSPPSVPARGAQEAIVSLDRPGAVRLRTVNPQGTACEILDHLRGPFQSSGAVGGRNCDTDLLLDAGSYKLRLTSPKKGKGTVAIKAEPFVELNEKLLRLEPGRQVEQKLGHGQQASYWIHLDERKFVVVRASGRTAGLVRLWRSGEWAEAVPVRDAAVSPLPGQPIHEAWIEQWLEAGDYLVTVYGTQAHDWTRGTEEDTLSLEYGFAPAPEDRRLSATIPAWGLVALELPKHPLAAFLALPAAVASATDLEVLTVAEDGQLSARRVARRCRVEPKALVPECAILETSEVRHVLLVRGAPGTRFELQWARHADDTSMADGRYAGPTRALTFRAAVGGDHLVAVHDVPADGDDAPLGCVLRRERRDQPPVTIARDFLPLVEERALERRFNYDGNEAAIWFEVPRAASYIISTGEERRARCELFRVEGDSRTRLSETADARCRIERALSPGAYELRLYDGDAGIETLRIAPLMGGGLFSGKPKEATEKAPGAKSACLFPRVPLEKDAVYRIELNRAGAIAARGLVLRPHPLEVDAPLPVEVAPGATLTLPLGAGRPLVVSGGPGAAFSCVLGGADQAARDGRCKLSSLAGPEALRIVNGSGQPLAVMVHRPAPPRALPPLPGWTPTFAPLPRLSPGQPVHLDFARNEAHSLVFEVAEAGLYHVATEGLLATSCRLRTPATPALASDTGGGRGRNCLVASYLRPGRYLVTVETTGQSRGRGTVILERRAVSPGPAVAADEVAYFRAAAGELVAQKLTVKKAGPFQLETFARNASLSCRLEDQDGWPLVAVPTPCSTTQTLAAGQYRWMQLPMTVESMRRTRLERIRPAPVLSGDKPHTLALNRWYSAKLGKDGKDELLFSVEAELDVQITLTDQMQGRLYRIEADASRTPVEIIAAREPEQPEEDEYQEEYVDEDSEPSDESEDGEHPEPAMPARAQQASSLGQVIRLTSGRYLLVAEHSRADVAVSYRIFLGTETLTPGMSREVQVPAKLPLRLSREGVLRLRTAGEADVRCRIVDQAGRVIAESSENGQDWNCSLAEPIDAGDYSLVIESETLTAGSTTVSLSMPANEDAGGLVDGATLAVGATVLSATVPAQPEGVQELDLRATGAFSCALLDANGRVVFRNRDGRDCAVLLRQGQAGYRLRLWTREQPMQVTARIAARPIVPLGGRLQAGQAGRAVIERPGRYRTGHQVWCQPERERGPLRACGPEVSLDAGPVVFSAFGTGTEIRIALEDVVVDLGAPSTARVRVGRTPFIGAARAASEALHLLAVRGLSDEGAAPSCALDGGARLFRGIDCFAASGPSRTALARWWASGDEGDAEITRRAIALPRSATPLAGGEHSLTWSGSVARYSLPEGPFRLELALPASTWAVLLDGRGAVSDLCAPSPELARCVLGGRGGELVIESAGAPRAEATLVLGEVPGRAVLFAGFYEALVREPGTLRLEVPAASGDRMLEITGARDCVLRLADGARVAGCRARLPAGMGAEALVVHGPGALRAVAHAPGRREQALFANLPASTPEPLEAARALALHTRTDRTLVLEEAAVVHLQSDSGVCALVYGQEVRAVDGLGAGCRIHRLLEPGTWRVVVRSFGSQPLFGALWWTATAVEPLGEGVGPERLIGPGQARLYRFTTASQGRIGLGLQVPAETLRCTLLSASQEVLGTGCQQLLSLDKGSYLLEIRSPESAAPTWFRPVLFGLAGARMGPPEETLRRLFELSGGRQ